MAGNLTDYLGMNENTAVEKSLTISREHNSINERLRHWSVLLGKFVSIQLLVQLLGSLAGLLLVRTLSQREYAYFTLASTMQATLLLLADVGVSSALSGTGGQVWQDKQRFSELIATGLYVRKKLAWFGGLVSVPILCWMLLSNGTGVIYAIILTVAVLIGASFRLTSDVLSVVPRLLGRIDQLQKLDVVSSFFRLAIISACCVTFINAALGIFIASFSFGLQLWLLRRWTKDAVNLKAPVNSTDKRTIIHVVKQQALTTIGYCFHGQLMIFLISYFGNTHSIAEIGALGRLTAIMSVIGTVMSNILLPKFARCQERQKLQAMWLQITTAFVLLSVFLMLLAQFVPEPMLWLLGKQYSHATNDLRYMVLGTVLSTITGALFSLNASRAWMEWSWLQVPIGLGSQIILFHFLDLSTVKGVVLISSLPVIPGAVIYIFRALRGFREMPDAVSKQG